MAPVSIRRVLISESVDPSCKTILQENGIEVTERQNMSKDELIAQIKDYDGLIVRSATKVTADVIGAASSLKVIGRAGTGVDNVDVDVATKKGIIVMNTPSGNTISAAELTCTLLMSLSRHVLQAAISMKAENWDRKKFMGAELYGKTLGIVGLGRIGKEVATRMQSFGMRTIGYDPITPPEVSASWGVEQMSLEELWPQCDYITVHTPLMPSTTGLLNDVSFAKCKRGVKVVNCARGGIIDEAALLRALESGQCGGAGLDVFVEEPPRNWALVKHPNVISCPHLGASTKEAQARCGQDIALQIVDMVKGKALVGAVNAQVLASTFTSDSQQWIRLGEAMGRVLKACSSSKQPYAHVHITTQGDCLKKSAGFLSSAAVVGLLSEGTGNGPNLVNALPLAEETGITIKKSHSDVNEANGTCMVEVSVNGSIYTALGSVRAEVPILLELNGSVFRQPIPLFGNLLFFKAAGSPQLLPSVASILAAAGVEMDYFSASTASEGDQWYCMGIQSLLGDLGSLKPLKNGRFSTPGIMSAKDHECYTYEFCDDSHPSEMLDALHEFYTNDLFTDITLCCSTGRMFHCHKTVLSARSAYFKVMFTLDMRERSNGIISLPSVDGDILSALVNYVYTSKVSITQANVQSLLEAADLLQFSSVKKACEEFLIRCLDVDNCLGMHSFAELHVCPVLEHEALRIILGRFEELVYQEEFLGLDLKKLIAILSAQNLNVWREETLLEAVVKWVTFTIDARRDCVQDLLHCIQLEVDDMYLRTALEVHKACNDHKLRSIIIQSTKSGGKDKSLTCKKPSSNMYVVGGYYWHPLSEIHIWDPISNTWAQGKDLPDYTRESYGVSLLGSNIYVTGGYRTETVDALDTVWIYNVDSDKWTEGCPMITARYYHCSVPLHGCIYAIGGYRGGAPARESEFYDPLKKKWFPVADMIQGVGNATACVVQDRI
ncbi:hypothetical protein SRHO_G00107250 [Serrasalmus rhombeus]